MLRAVRLPMVAIFLSLLGAAVFGADPRFLRTYGATATSEDRAQAIAPAVGGGYFLAGTSVPGTTDYDFWLVKADASGAAIWSFGYGSSVADYLTSMDATADGGAVMAGYTYGFEGGGDIDILVVKVDAAGAIQWAKTYAGNPATGTPPGSWGDHDDWARAIRQTADGGYILVGDTYSFGSGVNKSTPETDGWAMKLNATGGVVWEKTYGDQFWWAAGTETFRAVAEDSDGNFGVTGWARSYGPGREELWVLKLSGADGSWSWVKILPVMSYGLSIEATADGGFVVGGYGYFSTQQLLLARLTGTGAVSWARHYGGEGYEWGGFAAPAPDGGFILAGNTDSFGAGGTDAWVVKTDATGGITWQRAFGGTGTEDGRAASAWPGGGYLLAAQTNSLGASYDYWALRLGDDGLASPSCAYSVATGAPGTDITESWYSPAYTPPDPPLPSSAPSSAIVTAVVPTRTGTTADSDEQCDVHGPYLVRQSHLIVDNGNGDGIPDPGETLTVTVTARNAGVQDASSITGLLISLTTGVTVTQNTSAYPDLAVGSSGACATAYTVAVAPSVRCGTTIQFGLGFDGEGPVGTPFTNGDLFEVSVGVIGTPVTLLDEDFGSGLPPTWTVVNGGDPAMTWASDDPCARGLFPTPYMIADTWCAGTVAMDEELITPVLDCSAAFSVVLAFDNRYYSYYDIADVDVRSSITGGAWQNIVRWTSNDVGSRSFDISTHAAGAADVQVRWHFYNANYGWYWGIDNVQVTAVSATCDPLGPVPGAFALLSPADGATGQGCSLTLDWEDASGATAYDVYLGTTTSPALHASDVAVSQLGVTGLTMGSGYYWTVVAKNAEGTTATATWDFAVKAAPTVTGSASGCTFPGVVLSTQSFSTYQWAKDGSDIGGATLQTYTAAESGNYTVRVTDGAGCSATSAAHALAVEVSPSTPAAPAVADLSACASTGVSVTWGVVAGATGYDLRVDGSTVYTDVASPQTFIPGDTAGHTFQVRAKTATCTGDWSSGTDGADVNLTPPPVGTLTMVKSGNDLTISWTQVPDPGAVDYYEVMRALNPAGPFDVRVGTATGIVHGIILNLSLEPPTAYYKVRAVKGSCLGSLD